MEFRRIGKQAPLLIGYHGDRRVRVGDGMPPDPHSIKEILNGYFFVVKTSPAAELNPFLLFAIHARGVTKSPARCSPRKISIRNHSTISIEVRQ